jgi:outer membrane protein assembly factor BamB
MQISSCYGRQAALVAIGLAAALASGCRESGSTPSVPGGAAAGNVQTASWPMFRGDPSLTGVAPGSLPAAMAVAWKFKTGDSVKSSPVIADGKVFVGSDDGNVYALGLKDGQKVWATKTEGPVQAPPLYLEGAVYVGSSDGFLYALDAATGTVRWKYETQDKILGAANWTKSPKGDATWILVGSYDSRLHAVDARTGEAVWTFQSQNYINGSPAIWDAKAVFGGCDAHLRMISMADGSEAGDVEAGAYIAGSAAVSAANQLLCVDLVQKKIAWTWTDRDFPIQSSPALSADLVLFGSQDMLLHAVRRDTGKSAWTMETRGQVNSSPVVCGDKVVFGSDDGRVYLVKLADGKELWSYEIGQPVTTCPAVAAGMVVVGADDDCVYAFRAK